MRIKSTENLSNVATIAIFIIWLLMTFALLWGFSNELQYQLLFGVLGGITFECLHLWSLIKTKTYWNSKDGKAVPYFIMYILMGFFTVLAAVSFSGKTINAFATANDNSKMIMVTLKETIDDNKKNIEGYDRLRDSYSGDTNKIRSFNNAVSLIERLRATNDILIDKYQAMLTNNKINVKSESSDAFEFYANTLKWPKSWIIIILLILFFGSIEYGFFLSAPQEEKKLILSENRDELLKYVDSLMNIEDGKIRLKRDEDISKETNINIRKCREYRNILSGRAREESITWKNSPLIDIKQGSTKANFTKDDIKKIIINKANLN